ncbi:hypothetical protein ASZ78_010582 [Callipepla squamata]|uniref:Cytosol aminopeptidase domain-containing protein n=1 Tax=Callipepla squamata TaxID=9009 RepID=A0A226MR58_CALSU|nr:hypothetical protein ASZ78_010582 [Callipepla squamata]
MDPSKRGHPTSLLLPDLSVSWLMFQMVCERSEVFASACALARAFPLFTHRSSASRCTEKKTVTVEFFLVGQNNGPIEVATLKCLASATEGIRLAARIVDTPCNEMNTDNFLECLASATEGIRLAARIVDTPCNEMNTDNFLEEIKKVGKDLGITPTIIRDEELKERGFGGIYGVGKAALHPPALAVLSHTPDGATQTIAWVGKGIVYDTGGLSIKGKTTMPGMKRDCGGAAAILGAFRATVKQGIATGKYHAAVLTNNEEWEKACVKAGRNCGDLVHPLVYCPELHFSEFTSAVADMKNSVADRDNTPSSCAGLFIASHIGFDWPGVWVHIDIAAPVHAGERATGYGVALLLSLFGGASEDPLLNMVSPLGCNGDSPPEDMERDSKRRRLV